jgi:hypothetical protein
VLPAKGPDRRFLSRRFGLVDAGELEWAARPRGQHVLGRTTGMAVCGPAMPLVSLLTPLCSLLFGCAKGREMMFSGTLPLRAPVRQTSARPLNELSRRLKGSGRTTKDA